MQTRSTCIAPLLPQKVRAARTRPSPPPRAARRRPGTEGQSPVTLPGTTPAIPGRPRAARRIPTLPRPCAPGRTSRKTPPGGRTAAPTLAAIHRPRGRASRLAQASRERLRAMRRGRRGKSPVTLPRTTPRQKDAHAASPDGRRKARRRGRSRRSSVARPASSQAVPRGACAAVRTVDGQRRRGGSGQRAANVSVPRARRGRPPLAPPFPPSCSPLSPRSSLRSHAPSALRRGFSAGRASARNIGRRH